MFDERTRLSKDVVSEVRRHFGDRVYQSIVPRNIRLAEAPSHGIPVLQYDIKSRGAQAYLGLAREMLPGLAAVAKPSEAPGDAAVGEATSARKRLQRRDHRSRAGSLNRTERANERDQRTTEGDRPHAQGTRPGPRCHPPAGGAGASAGAARDPDRADRAAWFPTGFNRDRTSTRRVSRTWRARFAPKA